MRPLHWIGLGIVLVLLGLAGPAGAGVIYVKADAAGTSTGLSWTNAYTDLQAALAAARSGDEIWVAAGTYKPTSGTDRTKSFVMKEFVTLYGGFAGDEDTCATRNWTEHETILSGDIGTSGTITDNSHSLVAGANNAVLDGFTISKGTGIYGGGMINDTVSPTIRNCTFSGNTAGFGGGMYNNNSSPTVTICAFRGNTASLGGGMYNVNNSSPTVTNCAFSGNTGINGDGGGMYNLQSSPTVIDCAFTSNTAINSGAGMYNARNSPFVKNCYFGYNMIVKRPGDSAGGGMMNNGASPMVTNCMFIGNTAYYGGGINNNSSSAIVRDCIFSGNIATLNGGGIINISSLATVTNCIFSGNTATKNGGGICINSETRMVNGCVFTGNSADKGGGIYLDGGTPTIINCTFHGNSAYWGGGMENFIGYPTCVNCIFWGNIANAGAGFYNFIYGTPTFSNCDIQGSGGSGTEWDSNLGTDGGGNIMADPQFVDAVHPAGPDGRYRTEDDGLALQFGSPCIDAGTTTSAPATDILGNPRVKMPDMGAYEFQGLAQVLAPNGGEILPGGSLNQIRWQTRVPQAGTAVRLDLYDDQGWVADLGDDWNPQGQGDRELYLPLALEGVGYRIRATSVWNPVLWDESDTTFTITGGPLRVNWPNGGEVWTAGTPEWIWWEANPYFAGTAVRLELWRGTAKVTDLGDDWQPDGEGLKAINVPNVAPGSDYTVRAISLWDTSLSDASDGPLTIRNDAWMASARSAVPPDRWALYE